MERKEHPKPQFERENWMNLNGEWEFEFDFGNSGEERGLYTPDAPFSRKIKVPFCPESALSGIGYTDFMRSVWYRRKINLEKENLSGRVFLHFGAVDHSATVYVNGRRCGSHKGGYVSFKTDVTPFVREGENVVVVHAEDDIKSRLVARGKQAETYYSEQCVYTRTTGIWQTVWLEAVPQQYIKQVKTTPDLDRKSFRIEVPVCGAQPEDRIEVALFDGDTQVAKGSSLNGAAVELSVAEPKLWSPESPFLYDMKVSLVRNGKKIDEVESYTAMRKFSIGRDADDIVRLELNNEPVFQFGPLDQGWWPDGLYTAPSDEALAFDVIKTKDLGYNMIRKHVKVEPARWYYHCDKLGMIVWQDMPSGDRGPQWQMHNYFTGEEKHRSAESEANFRKEWKEIIDYLYSSPSIGVWVPFNECWGQFKTQEIVEWTKAYDPSRLVNPASGGNHYLTGDILDTHHYPNPRLTLLDTNRATVLGEYGGIGFVMKGHLWEPDRNWGYIRLNSPKEVTDEYEKYAEMLYKLIGRGFSAGVYTQTTDVEMEVNGLMTYDRKEMKVEPERIRKINQKLCNALGK